MKGSEGSESRANTKETLPKMLARVLRELHARLEASTGEVGSDIFGVGKATFTPASNDNHKE